jgi:ABC-2 type transport system ATP-binding protein
MAVIETFKLTKKFDKITAVDNLNLQIEEGEVFGLLGPNGAGKTTTIKMLATLLKPTSGSAKVNGFDILKEPSQVRKSIGIVFQEPSSDELLTGYENLKLHALMYGIPKSEIEKSINDVLELVELSERRNDIVKKYSGGMRRRLEIARGLMHKPKILFLDEPTLGLDPSGRKKMWEYIQRLVKELNVTILLTTHYMEEADFLADRVGIIDHGKIVALDSPAALKKIVGGDLITLKADAPDLSSLRKVSYIRKVEEVDGKILLTVENVAENLPKILKLINGVQSVEVRSPTLNDVFLHFTGRQIHEEAEGGWFEKIIQQSVVKE